MAFFLSGSLEEIPLPDIARLFQSTRKTGRLALVSGASTGAIYFDRGGIVDCQVTNMAGLDALKHVALFNRGTFDFADGVAPSSKTLAAYETSDLIEILESRMLESRQLQELMPTGGDIPRYLGGAIPAGLEVGAADLAIALKASSGTHSVRMLAAELNLEEATVRYTIARFRAAGLMDIVGTDETPVPHSKPAPPAPRAADSPTPQESVPGSPVSAPGAQPRYWRGRKIE